MNKVKILVLSFFLFFMPVISGIAQDDMKPVEYSSKPVNQTPVPMADLMREEGKIYVVVAVMLIILAGLIIFLIMIDRKVSRLEKEFRV